MKVLLDTHTLLWFIHGDERLSPRSREIILDHLSQLYYSMVSIWEITIKESLGKIELSKNWLGTIESELIANGVQRAVIDFKTFKTLSSLPFHHRDPFDRLLISQAMSNDMTLLSRDTILKQYTVNVIW